jgi:hypothetical protein
MGRVERIVFLSLVLDLFGKYYLPNSRKGLTTVEAFTIPLPLFPRIIEWYTVVSEVAYGATHSIKTLPERRI